MEKSIFVVVIYAVEILIAYMYLSDWFELKYKRAISVLICILCYLPTIICCVFLNNVIINTLMYFVSNTLMAYLAFKATKSQAIVHSVIITILMYLSEVIVIGIYSMSINMPTSSYANDFNDLVALGILSKITYLFLTKLLSFILTAKRPVSENFGIKHIVLLIFPAIIFILLFIELYITRTIKLPQSVNIALSVTNIASLFFSIMIFLYYDNLTKKEQNYQQVLQENLINNIDKTYIQVLESQYEDVRIFVHDIKAHLSTMYSFQDIDDIERYIENLVPIVEKKVLKFGTGNHILDIILNKYQVICSNNDISLHISVIGTNLSYIDNTQLSSLLNNVMDNAIEAASNAQEKAIEFVIRKENATYDVLSVVNTCYVTPKKRAGSFITTKKNSKWHGIGTKSIKRCVERNNGQVYMRFEDKDKMFHFTALFKSPKDNRINIIAK